MSYVIAQPCVDVKDKACIDECPVDCIYEGQRSLYIHPSECVDCGACDPVCPVEAIYYAEDVPDEWADYVRANAEFFEEEFRESEFRESEFREDVGRDHPVVMAEPARVGS
jgi:NAD-dependent dihydropyrimidine dehydrogenase PreA subunit